MTSLLSAWTVANAIPSDVWAGLLTGQYKLTGGVIRWTAGTAKAGQIVRHLIPDSQTIIDGFSFNPVTTIFTAINTYQIHNLTEKVDLLSSAMQQVLQVATGTMVLGGLNLAVSSVSFAALDQKLNQINDKLTHILSEVKEIRLVLERAELAELRAALLTLVNISKITDIDTRRAILVGSRQVLAKIEQQYKELFKQAHSIDTALAYEEYFCLTALAHARCYAELRELGMARQALEETVAFWNVQARRIADKLLLGEHPERFLSSDFAQEVPIAALVEWLDFARSEKKGYSWIDELRQKTSPWYPQSWFTKPAIHYSSSELPREKEKVIPLLKKLVARGSLLDGYIAQYELLEQHHITPSEFEQTIELIALESTVDGYLILEPMNDTVVDLSTSSLERLN